MLKVPSFNLFVGSVLNMSKEWQRNLHSLFTMKDLQISVDITSWGFIRALNLSDADVDDNENYDEGFEDEDYD